MKTLFLTLLLSGFALSSLFADVIGGSVTGTPEIAGIEVISFAPEGVLLIGDGRSAQIITLKTGDTTPATGDFAETKDFRTEIAGRLGVGGKDVEILDLAVNPASERLYLAVRKQDDKTHVILRVSPGGEIELVSLSDVEFAKIPLPKGDSAPVSKVTDVVWADNRLIAAARCNEEFASKIFVADGPLSHDKAGSTYSAETYHVSHRKWETRAPMSVMIPYEEDGKHYIVGAFSCTPVVKYPLDAITPGAKIKGVSMIELGSGNRPLDMFGYETDGKPSVLTNTFRFHHQKRPHGPSPHLAFRFDEALLGDPEATNENAIHREKTAKEGTVEIAEPFHGVIQMDRLNETTAIALREGTEGAVDLIAIALP